MRKSPLETLMPDGSPFDPSISLFTFDTATYRQFDRAVQATYSKSIGEIADVDYSFAVQALGTGLRALMTRGRDTLIEQTVDDKGVEKQRQTLSRKLDGPDAYNGHTSVVSEGLASLFQTRFLEGGVDKAIVVIKQPGILGRRLGKHPVAKVVALMRYPEADRS